MPDHIDNPMIKDEDIPFFEEEEDCLLCEMVIDDDDIDELDNKLSEVFKCLDNKVRDADFTNGFDMAHRFAIRWLRQKMSEKGLIS